MIAGTFVKNNLLSIAILVAWASYMASQNAWHIFETGWPMTVTNVFASFVAGSTPLGSGAVSYPVMVLVLNVVSNNARTCALMIQSVGMSCASYRLLRLHNETLNANSLLYMMLTGAVGYNIGYYLVRLPGDYVKSIYFSLTLSLGVLIQAYVNKFIKNVERNDTLTIRPKDLFGFFPVTILGGILISMVGTGIDVVLYVYFRLAHNTEELVTTNHTIIVQSFMVLFGFYNALVINPGDITPIVMTYWLCSVPAVVVFAPVGSYVANRWITNRENLNKYVYVLEIFQYVSGFVITIARQWQTIVISSCIVGSTALSLAFRYAWYDRKHAFNIGP